MDLRKLDVFPKTQDEVRIRTTCGGLASMIAVFCTVALLLTELRFWVSTRRVDHLVVDSGRLGKLRLIFDITFHRLPCEAVSIDVVDDMGRQLSIHHGVTHKINRQPLDASGTAIDNGPGQTVRHLGGSVHELRQPGWVHTRQRGASDTNAWLYERGSSEGDGDGVGGGDSWDSADGADNIAVHQRDGIGQNRVRGDASMGRLFADTDEQQQRCGSCYGAASAVLPCCNSCADLRRAHLLRPQLVSWPPNVSSVNELPPCVAERRYRDAFGSLIDTLMQADDAVTSGNEGGNSGGETGVALLPLSITDDATGVLTRRRRLRRMPDGSFADEGCRINGHIQMLKVTSSVRFAPHRSFGNVFRSFAELLRFTAVSFNTSHTVHSFNFGPRLPGLPAEYGDDGDPRWPLEGTVRVPHDPRAFRNGRRDVDAQDEGEEGLEGTMREAESEHEGANTQSSADWQVPQTSAPGSALYQYFLQLVPTTYRFLNDTSFDTNQYSATDLVRFIASDGSDGDTLPGVIFVIEPAPVKVVIEEERRGAILFLTSACAIIGGVFASLGLVDGAVHVLLRQRNNRHLH